MLIRDLIRRPIETLPPTATCAAAAALMRDQQVGAVVVTEDGRPAGIVTDRDIVVRVIAETRDPEVVRLCDVMSTSPVFLPTTSSIESALRTMREMKVRRIPTVDAQGRLEGMLSLDDVLVSLGRQIAAASDVAGAALAVGG